MTNPRFNLYLKAAIVPILLIFIWGLAVKINLIPLSQAADPLTVLIKMGKLLIAPSFLLQLFLSLKRLVIGSILALILGAFIGLFLVISPLMNKLFSPTLNFLAGLPVVLWMPFWIMLFGLGETFKIGLAAMGAFFLVYTYSTVTANATSRRYMELCQVYEKSKSEILFKVLLPESLSAILTALRISLGIGWIVLFFVEYATADLGKEGLGWFIANARAVGRVEEEFAGLIILALTAFLLDNVILVVQKKLVYWKQTLEGINERKD